MTTFTDTELLDYLLSSFGVDTPDGKGSWEWNPLTNREKVAAWIERDKDCAARIRRERFDGIMRAKRAERCMLCGRESA